MVGLWWVCSGFVVGLWWVCGGFVMGLWWVCGGFGDGETCGFEKLWQNRGEAVWEQTEAIKQMEEGTKI